MGLLPPLPRRGIEGAKAWPALWGLLHLSCESQAGSVGTPSSVASSHEPLNVSALLDSPPGDSRQWGTKTVATPGLLKSLSSLSRAGPFLWEAPPAWKHTGKTWSRLSKRLEETMGGHVIIYPVIRDQLGVRTSSQLKDKLRSHTFVPVPGPLVPEPVLGCEHQGFPKEVVATPGGDSDVHRPRGSRGRFKGQRGRSADRLVKMG